ncbi:hypothetical protein Val02_23770 [Virgisporangium aliadipatigenens]|uniref:GGDEF domain-containing protein n=1 Tax=Virgisporangium aliadipatigenens TaxID=741659 RepID=A0A8J4DQ19_9ACTN|nr:GGDEF domain-containing protein [Virgisporangium aliadipatigenens]GIJ45491.1 hypothetical protein Val02_23770 [Virgisporangium aliadipatigenens]
MPTSTRPPIDAPLRRTQRIAFAAAGLALVAHTVPVLSADISAGWRTAAVASIAALLGIMAWTTFRTRPVPLEPVLVPALLCAVAAAMPWPMRTVMITIAVFAVLALHGSIWAWGVRTVLGLAVLPVGTALAALSGAATLSWRSGEVLGMIPSVVPVGLVMRQVRHVLLQQQVVSGRDALLASAGERILAAEDVDEVQRIGRDLATRMVALDPGTVLIIVRPQDGQLRVARSLGLAEQLRGRGVSDEAMGRPAEEFADVAPHIAHWRVEPTADGYLVLGRTRPITAVEFDAFRNLMHQVVLGEMGLRSRAELMYRAHHDYLTRLANRELFFTELVRAAETEPAGSVVLLSIDLDDFKQVNDTYGHAAGDEVLIEVARRIQAAAGPNGLAARFGGDEFALLLTGLPDEHDAEPLAYELCERIHAPIVIGGGLATVRVGASIGISSTESALTATELVFRADLAMYGAKSEGKNRVRHFDLGAGRAPVEAGAPAPGDGGPSDG